MPEDMELEHRMASMDETTSQNVEKLGHPSTFTCPECEGPLWEIQDQEILRFRCRVGHAYTAESMLAGRSEALEGAMWAALNTLEEGAQMSRRLAADSRARGHESTPRCVSRSGRGRRGSRLT